MRVKLINFHLVTDVDLLVENHVIYLARKLKMKDGPLMYLVELT